MQAAPYINTSIAENNIDTSNGYLTNVTHGNHVKNRSIIFHTREGEYNFQYVKNRVTSKGINGRCCYFHRKGVNCKATASFLADDELIKCEKINNKSKFSLIEDDSVYDKRRCF